MIGRDPRKCFACLARFPRFPPGEQRTPAPGAGSEKIPTPTSCSPTRTNSSMLPASSSVSFADISLNTVLKFSFHEVPLSIANHNSPRAGAVVNFTRIRRSSSRSAAARCPGRQDSWAPRLPPTRYPWSQDFMRQIPYPGYLSSLSAKGDFPHDCQF